MRFQPKEYVFWFHPLGLFYSARVVKVGWTPLLGEWAIISLDNKCLVFVPQKDLCALSQKPAEKDKPVAESFKGVKLIIRKGAGK